VYFAFDALPLDTSPNTPRLAVFAVDPLTKEVAGATLLTLSADGETVQFEALAV